MESILTSIKDHVGIDEGDGNFDDEIIDHINAAFSALNDINVGPPEGFGIEDDKTFWTEFTDDIKVLGSVKDFVQLSVKLAFDPPTQAALLSSMERRLSKLEWRLQARCDTT